MPPVRADQRPRRSLSPGYGLLVGYAVLDGREALGWVDELGRVQRSWPRGSELSPHRGGPCRWRGRHRRNKPRRPRGGFHRIPVVCPRSARGITPRCRESRGRARVDRCDRAARKNGSSSGFPDDAFAGRGHCGQIIPDDLDVLSASSAILKMGMLDASDVAAKKPYTDGGSDAEFRVISMVRDG